MVSCALVYQILWVRGFRDYTIFGRGFNLFKPLRRHFRATPFLPSGPCAPIPETPRFKRPDRGPETLGRNDSLGDVGVQFDPGLDRVV